MTAPTPATCNQLLDALSHLMRARRRMIELLPDVNFTTLLALGAVEQLRAPRIGALAETLRVDCSVASRQVAALEADGLLRRVRDDSDRRATNIELTENGEEWLRRFRERTGDQLADLLSGFGDADIADLARRLDAVSGAMCDPAAVAPHHGPPPPAPDRTEPPPPPASTAPTEPTHQLESVTR
jgi:DNA-binding MarR family transcriptional regulator